MNEYNFDGDENKRFVRGHVSDIELTNAMLDESYREIFRSVVLLHRAALNRIGRNNGQSEGFEMVIRCGMVNGPPALVRLECKARAIVEDPLAPGVFK